MKFFFKSIRFFLSVAVLFVTISFHVSLDYNNKSSEENLIEDIVKEYTKQHDYIFNNPDKYELQIIYTQINRDATNKPSYKQYSYNLNSKNYFYAASMVKLPCSLLALEKINNLKIKNLDKNTVMFTDSAFSCQKKITTDTTTLNKKPSVANYIKRMLLISDDDAYGRIYEFLGQEYINNKLKEKGFQDIRIVHRFDANCGQLANKHTNPIEFFDEKGNSIYKQHMQISQTKYANPVDEIKRGKAYMNHKNKLVKEAKDFTNMNYMTLQDIDAILKSIIFPDSQNPKFNLTKSDYTFLYKYLSMYPRESDYPKYDFKKFEDSYKKYLFYGTHHKKILKDSFAFSILLASRTAI